LHLFTKTAGKWKGWILHSSKYLLFPINKMFGNPSSGFGNNPSGFGNSGGSGSLFGNPNSGGGGGNMGGGGGGLFGGGGGGGITSGGSSLFGNSGGGSNLFGNQPTGSSEGPLYGGSSNTGFGGGFGSGNPSFGAGTGGGGLFGNSSTTGAGGGLFGSSGGGAGSSSLFGNSTGGGLFGSATSGSNLFGNNTASRSSGGLFGGSSSAGGFGSASGFGPGSGGLSGGFGTPAGGGMFASGGGNQGMFGVNQPSMTGGAFGFQQNQQQMLQPVDRQGEFVIWAETNAPWWYRELVKIQAAYRVDRFSKFMTMMYEVSPVAPDIHVRSVPINIGIIEQTKAERKKQILQQIPWMDNHMREWQLFEERNPDPANWLPCPVIGVDALSARVEAQIKYTQEQLRSVEKEKNKDWLASASADILALDQKIESCRRAHTNVTSRLIAALGRLERLQARYGSIKGPRSASETRFSERLQKVKKQLDDPKGCKAKLLQVETRLGEIVTRRGELKDDTVVIHQQTTNQPTSETSAAKAKETEDDQRNQQLQAFLAEQKQSIATVIETLRRDARDVQMMREKLAS
jgi:hypothetical protein